jgi:hypothetical protein
MRSFLLAGFLIFSCCAHAQIAAPITKSEVTMIEQTLADDNMRGRKVFTPDIDRAASFIAREFAEAGLKPFSVNKTFLQSFAIITPENAGSSIVFDGVPLRTENIFAFTAASSLQITEADHYTKVFVRNKMEFSPAIHKYLDSKANVLILVDTSASEKFRRFAALHVPQFTGCGNRIFVLTSSDPKKYSIGVKQKIKIQQLTNVIGVIPGKSKPGEFVIFSAHYDHLGVGAADAKGDSIYNGANDDASGTTAVIELAKYFMKLHNNERTLVFAAFTAEEISEFGSAYFSNTIDTLKIRAMLNIEMIGTESKWGRNSAYITGYDKTDLGAILQKNLMNTDFRFYPDPYPEQMLFLRSDNAALAKKGVAAITISTSKMDSEKYYHTKGDEVSTLDLDNMTEIIRAIGLSAASVISGADNPLRVKPE